MFKLYKFELKKLHHSVTFWICLIIFSLIVAAMGYINGALINSVGDTIEWTQEQIAAAEKDMTESEKKQFEEQLEWQKNGGAIQHIQTEDSETAKFAAENNINEECGIPGFVEQAFESTSILAIVLSVVVSVMVSQEYSNSTIKLSLISGHRRDEIIGGKLLALFTAVIEFIFSAAILTLIASIAYFLISKQANPEPWNCLKMVFLSGRLTAVPAWARLIMLALMAILEAFMFASFAFFISILTKNTPVTIILPIVAALIPTFISSEKLTNNVVWRHLFFNLQGNYQLWSPYVTGSSALWTALLTCAIWTVLFVGASFVIFEQRDVYN